MSNSICALVDNDILLKGACYGLLPELVGTIAGEHRIGFLGAARFVLPKLLSKKILRTDPSIAKARLVSFLAAQDVVEPTSQEQEFAALLEGTAQRLLVNLDTGESQLLAILIMRTLPWLMTGDKRAVFAIEHLRETDTMVSGVDGKLICLEQLVLRLLGNGKSSSIRTAICSESAIDRALSVCFSCASPEISADSARDALNSYIEDLRRSAPHVLST